MKNKTKFIHHSEGIPIPTYTNKRSPAVCLHKGYEKVNKIYNNKKTPSL